MTLLAGLIFIAMPAYSAKKNTKTNKVQNTVETPDFAFPKTVIDNAETELRKAAIAGDDDIIIRCAIQLVIANNDISTERMPQMAQLLDSLAQTMSAPTSAILYSLEAELYKQVYSADMWQYRQRTLPLDSYPENPQEWSSQLFAKKVCELVQKSLTNSDLLNSTPIKIYKHLLDDYNEQACTYYPTLYSLLAKRSLDILDALADENGVNIPFGSKEHQSAPTQKCAQYRYEIARQWYDYAVEASDVPQIAVSLKSLNECTAGLSNQAAYDSYVSAYQKYNSSPYSADFLVYASQSGVDEQVINQQLLPLIEECLAAYPRARHANNLMNILKKTKHGDVNLSLANIYSPEQEIVATAKIENMQIDTYVCVFKIPVTDTPYIEYKEGRGKLVMSKKIPANSDTVQLNFGTLPAGRYIAVLSDDAAGIFSPKKQIDISSFVVTQYSFITLDSGNTHQLQLINPMNGRPYIGKQVIFSYKAKTGKVASTAITDNYGIVSIPEKFPKNTEISYRVSEKDDVVEGTIWLGFNQPPKSHKEGLILTDLALYHPGDTCRFSVVIFNENPEDATQHILSDIKLKAVLYNASGVKCDTIDLVTDIYGRANGKFVLPEGGLNGRFSINIEEDNNHIAGTSIRVEEYKQPTYYVELDDISDIVPPTPLVISGKVMTYSGMPLTGAKVQIDIELQPRWWRSFAQGSYSEEVTTDAEGKFKLTLSTNRLVDTDYLNNSYSVKATATSPAGESQESESAYTYIGSKIFIRYTGGDLYDAGLKEVRLPYELIGVPTANQKVKYVLTDDHGLEVFSGSSESSPVKIDSDKLPSGKYTLRLICGEAANTASVTFYRDIDKVPAQKTALWIPKTEITAPAEGGMVSISVGSAMPNTNIFYTVANDKRVLSQGFLLPDQKMTELKVVAPTERNNRVRVYFSTMDSCQYFKRTVTVIPAAALKNVMVEKISFRDKINAGGKESWTFRYTLSDKLLNNLPVIAVMTDKSLNAITPFSWHKPYNLTPLNIFSISSSKYRHISSLNYSYSCGKYLETVGWPNININTYGRLLYGRTLYIRGTNRMLRANAMADMFYDETESEVFMAAAPVSEMKYASATLGDVGTGAVEESADEAPEPSTSDNQQAKYRPSSMPLAWFKPNLTTDAEGNLELSFEAPNYNTTWQLQMLAYTPIMLSNLLKEDIVASKPVMASVNAPRFLRTGDKVVLLATLYNNTDKEVAVSGTMQIFNPLNNSVLINKEFNAEQVDANGSRLISLEFSVPSDVEFVGYRVMGNVPGYSDGEQSLVAILPSSSPVTESYPFYIAPSENVYTRQLPQMSENSQVSLQYCDNPIWECVTALPDMSFDSDASILSTANRLYGNAIASGLLKQYPQLGDAVKAWSESCDSTLISNLQKNEELKIVALNNTPWVLSAQSESLRMSRLVNLLNEENNCKEIEATFAKLQSEQKSNGGWAWCSGMEASEYITGQILWRLAMLNGMGYLDYAKYKSMITNALKYCDNELYQDYFKCDKTFSTSQMLNYLYIRSFFPEVAISPSFGTLKSKALKAIKKEWKDFDIYNKATAATLFNREKEPMFARTILESVNQYASTSAERGMWFDNLRSGIFTNNTLVTTAQALEAYNEVTPKSESIDLLRQWLIIERQAQDWGSDSQLAEVIYSILTTGSDWTVTSEAARIYLNGIDITPTNADAYTGSFVVALRPEQASDATLKIEKFGEHQAWGGVVTKQVKPIQDVQQFSESDVTISKRILLVENTENGTTVSTLDGNHLKVGQRIRIQLIVSSSRDMDYVVIHDEMGGFMSPCEQLSKYIWQDGIAYYREVKTDVNNLYIPRLPKGNFLVEYDCFVSAEGIFSTGIATLQSLYAPTLSAHSSGLVVEVK